MALITGSVLQALTSISPALGDIASNVNSAAETVSSVYDQINGKSQGLDETVKTTATPAVTPTAVAASEKKSYVTYIIVGGIVVVGLFILMKD